MTHQLDLKLIWAEGDFVRAAKRAAARPNEGNLKRLAEAREARDGVKAEIDRLNEEK